MSAVVETSFFRPRNVEFSNSKLDGEERGEGGGGGWITRTEQLTQGGLRPDFINF